MTHEIRRYFKKEFYNEARLFKNDFYAAFKTLVAIKYGNTKNFVNQYPDIHAEHLLGVVAEVSMKEYRLDQTCFSAVGLAEGEYNEKFVYYIELGKVMLADSIISFEDKVNGAEHIEVDSSYAYYKTSTYQVCKVLEKVFPGVESEYVYNRR